MIFAGSDNGSSTDVAGKIVVRPNPERLVAGPAAPAPPAGALAVIGVDAATGPEPARWPAQYAVAMNIVGTPIPASTGPIAFRFNPCDAEILFEGTGHTYRELRELAMNGQVVPSFPLGASMLAVVTGEEKGLLGSRYYTQHPTIPREQMVANINLDQTATDLSAEDAHDPCGR